MPRRPRRLRRRARRLRRAGARQLRRRASPATTTSRCAATLSLEEFSRGAALAAEWTQRGHRRRDARVPARPRAAGERRREVGLYHASPRDPVWEYVLSPLLAELCLDATEHRVSPDRPLARRAVVLRREGEPRDGRARAARATSSTSRAASGWSTRAASASRATAIRARPGCCWTPSAWTAAWRRDRVRRRGRRRRRSAPRDCPTRSPSACSTVSSLRRRMRFAQVPPPRPSLGVRCCAARGLRRRRPELIPGQDADAAQAPTSTRPARRRRRATAQARDARGPRPGAASPSCPRRWTAGSSGTSQDGARQARRRIVPRRSAGDDDDRHRRRPSTTATDHDHRRRPTTDDHRRRRRPTPTEPPTPTTRRRRRRPHAGGNTATEAAHGRRPRRRSGAAAPATRDGVASGGTGDEPRPSSPTATELERRLGVGGMSTVQLAFDRRLERHVAVKLLAEHLAEDRGFVSRFRREALAAARLVHPNIVQVFDFGFDEASQRQFIVMEYVPGQSCAEILREHGPARRRARRSSIVAQACRGLDYAHRNGVVHRDVKPGNLLRSPRGQSSSSPTSGSPRRPSSPTSRRSARCSAPPPTSRPSRRAARRPGRRSDLYALGVVAYQLLSGRLPYEATSLTELALQAAARAAGAARRARPRGPAGAGARRSTGRWRSSPPSRYAERRAMERGARATGCAGSAPRRDADGRRRARRRRDGGPPRRAVQPTRAPRAATRHAAAAQPRAAAAAAPPARRRARRGAAPRPGRAAASRARRRGLRRAAATASLAHAASLVARRRWPRRRLRGQDAADEPRSCARRRPSDAAAGGRRRCRT